MTAPDAEGRHCPSCTCGKRAPLQGEHRRDGKYGTHGDGTISWAEHLEAYAVYSARYGTSQSAQRLAERGGFSWGEFVDMTGHEPASYVPGRAS